jgi:hypothetical protein
MASILACADGHDGHKRSGSAASPFTGTPRLPDFACTAQRGFGAWFIIQRYRL